MRLNHPILLAPTVAMAIALAGCDCGSRGEPPRDDLHDVMIIAVENGTQFDAVIHASEPKPEETKFISELTQKRKYLIADDTNSIVLAGLDGNRDVVVETQVFSALIHGERAGNACDVTVVRARVKKLAVEKGIAGMRASVAPGRKVFLGDGGGHSYYLYMPIPASRFEQRHDGIDSPP